VPDDHTDYYNPRPKVCAYPYDDLAGNDIHGTPRAGLAAAVGNGLPGVAPSAKILAVKVFHASELASDERVADAIRYAATRADVISCSWTGGTSPDVEQALIDAGTLGRNGRGTAVFCATGNDYGKPVRFPSRASSSMAIGASTDGGLIAPYSNVGPEVDFVAPSGGGSQNLTTTRRIVSGPRVQPRHAGPARPDDTGIHWDVGCHTDRGRHRGALLAIQPTLDREALCGILRDSCEPMGVGAPGVASNEFGFGRLNATKAVTAAINHVP
jgi:hypothetical protein